MILRHIREDTLGQPAENSFEAIDERSGDTLGRCIIFEHHNDRLFPARPTRIYLEIEGKNPPDALLGAAVARAKELAMLSDTPGRVFTQVDPDDQERMRALEVLGLKDTDGLIKMRATLSVQASGEAPIGCVVVRDGLDNSIEQKFFLDRYNRLYAEEYDFEWLHELRAHEGFTRMLLVAPTGMVGEIIFWQKNNFGELAWLFVSPKWRRKGISQKLMELACEVLQKDGITSVEADVQARIPGLLRCMERAGFRQSELLQRYPGMDIG